MKKLPHYVVSHKLYHYDHLKIALRDFLVLSLPTRTSNVCISDAVSWLTKAQYDHGGFAAGYAFATGWMPPYPETTGYTIPTLLSLSEKYPQCSTMALHAANWLLQIQNPEGWYISKYLEDNSASRPSVFNTGQIIQGLVAAYQNTRQTQFLESAIKAGNWIIAQQHPSGRWEKWAYNDIPHVYYARVAWPLVQLGKITQDDKFIQAARNNLQWVLTNQTPSGWFQKNGFLRHDLALTHTISYTTEGLLESGVLLEDSRFIEAADITAAKLCDIFERDQKLLGRYDENWRSPDAWSCVTGDAQTSLVWLRLHEILQRPRYFRAAQQLNRHLRSVQIAHPGRKFPAGGVKGSHPAWGNYGRFSLFLHATKFFIDTLLLEEENS